MVIRLVINNRFKVAYSIRLLEPNCIRPETFSTETQNSSEYAGPSQPTPWIHFYACMAVLKMTRCRTD